MEKMIGIIIIALISIIYGIMSYKTNELGTNGVIFGVLVPIKYRDNNKIKDITRSFKKMFFTFMIISFLIFTALFSIYQKAYIMVIYLYALIAIQIYAYYKANKKMKIFKNEMGWSVESKNKIVVNIDSKEKIGNFNWYIIPIIIGVTSIIITLIAMPNLPKQVPLHIGINGEVDRWGDSSLLQTKLEVLMLPLINLGITILTLGTAKLSIKKSDRLNGGKPSEIKFKKKVFKKETSKMLLITTIATSIILCYANLNMLGFIEFNNYILMILIIILLAISLGYSFHVTFKTGQSGNKLRVQNQSSEKEIYRDDDDDYIMGLFYYNKKDPCKMIEKRVGIGYDFNYAHLLGKVLISLTTLFMIAIIVIMLIKNI